MSEIKVNKLSPRTNCGTVQLGDSGDTITIPAGATIVNNGTQTGFGRTGTVDWDTTAKTASFTAVSGNGYFVNTTSGAITVTLPASPSAGDIVAVADYAGTAATNNITIGRNGSNIEGGTTDGTISTNRETKTLVYVDGTQGWVPVNDNFDSTISPAFVTATGGTITTSGDYKIHTFTGPGTFCVSCSGNSCGSNTVDYLVVAGGGGGGGGRGGGGGAGGFRESHSTPVSGCYTASPLATPTALPVSITGYPITVGAGGSAGVYLGSLATPGGVSIFSTISSAGGGKGGGESPCANGSAGGSGGASSFCGPYFVGNTPPVSPPQGNDSGSGGGCYSGGGGGGATAAGNPSTFVGGAGATTSISSSPTTYGGGGGAGSNSGASAGGAGGGGDGSFDPSPGRPGTANTGGGAGGGRGTGCRTSGGSGGSGIVIIRYKFQ